MTEDDDEESQRIIQLLQDSEPDEGSSWPQLSDVPLDHRCRVWCLMTALEVAQNAGGKPAVDTARDCIQAASMFQDWITESKVPRKPSLVREETS